MKLINKEIIALAQHPGKMNSLLAIFVIFAFFSHVQGQRLPRAMKVLLILFTNGTREPTISVFSL